jgi:hypothetical protein
MSCSNIPNSIFFPDNKKQPQSFLANSKGMFGSFEAVKGDVTDDIDSFRQPREKKYNRN